MLNILYNAGSEFVAPTGIDHEAAADTGICELAFVGQAGFLEELTHRSVRMRFSVIETAGNGLPEIERLAAA